jgi:pilus assembly protein CpaC
MTTMIRRRATACSTVIILAVFGSMTVYAQKSQAVASAVAANASGPLEAKAAPSVDREPRQVRLLVGRSTLVEPGMPVTRVSLTSADIADVVVTSTSQLLLNGKVAGTTSMFVWDRGGSVRRYEIVVQRDLMRLTEQIKDLFPGETIDVRNNGTKIVLAGTASNKAVIDNVINLATGFVEKKEDVVSLLQPRDATPNNQVLLRVRFAEVSRSAMTELGASAFTGPNGYKDFLGRTTTQQFPAPTFDTSSGQNTLVFSDFLNLFLFDQKNQLGGVIRALQTKGLFQSLAEPNLVAESGKEASFLAGGEYPVPVAQASSGTVAITIQYKEFGIRLNFLPVVNGNRVHLKVRPEVSSLDFTNAVTLQGFRIPALSTRRTETELELDNGQTFAIAGLLSNSVNSSLQKIPGIGDIPILGLLFKSKAAQKDQSELVVMITPEILARNSTGVTNALPRTPESYLPPIPEKKSVEPPPPAFTTPRVTAKPDPLPEPRPAVTSAAPVADTPASAAATVQALTPNTRRVVHDAPANQAAPTPAPAQVAPGGSIQAATVTRPLTPDEQKRLDKARKQEQEKAKRDADAAAKLQAEMEKQQQEQARRDAELAAKLQKEQAKRDADAAAKAAKAQADADRKRQKALDEAAKNNKTQSSQSN